MDDLISRREAIETIAEFLYYPNNWDGMRAGFDLADWEWKIKCVLSDLPSVQAKLDENDMPEQGDSAKFGVKTGETCTDCISRQAAIEAICEHGTRLERRGITVLAVANHKQATVDLLESLPSAQPERCEDCRNFNKARLLIPQPERKEGKWIYLNGLDAFECSVCGRQMVRNIFDYCPWCGARMNGGDDGGET